MTAYYNEIDKNAAKWLRELIKNKLIADGEVDERSIADVQADDLRGFNQCHFFAGIGGWSYALRLAGIPDDYPVWTGSCPCQPFSVAGKNKGKADERHLWPEFHRLIAECRPITIFGEQVEGAVKHGWLDDLQADLEREDYTVGATVLGAHSVGALHKRQRLYWVAHAIKNRQYRERVSKKSRESVLFTARSNNKQPWNALPMPGNAKNSRELLLLADGVSAELEICGAIGNAIVPQVAAEFISAFMDITND